MRSIRPIVLATALVLAAPPMLSAIAADQAAEQPFGGPPAPPNRNVEERPFGGPPPKSRNPKRSGNKCETLKQTCVLEKRQTVGTKCTCPEDEATEGKIVD